jgi:predicted SnoaL-like aldol condensation-catalyzing enzyme
MRRSTHLAAAAALTLAACDTATVDTTNTVMRNAPVAASLAPPPAPIVEGRPVNVVGHPDPLSLLESDDPALAANKRLVFDMWRSIVNAGHVELADDMLQEGYVQHSPILPTGRAAFKQIFSAIERREVPKLVSPPLVTILAERDLVVMALREELPEPGGEGRYATTHFNLFRIEDGRLAEHWHSVQTPPGANVPPPEEGGPQRVTGVTGAAQAALLTASAARLAANKQLVFDTWKRAGRAGSSLADGFIEHDSAAPGPAPSFPPADASLVAMVAQGDLVVLVTGLEHSHPIRPGSTYTTTWFDMFRIEGGRLAEHWNGALKPGAPPAQYGS